MENRNWISGVRGESAGQGRSGIVVIKKGEPLSVPLFVDWPCCLQSSTGFPLIVEVQSEGNGVEERCVTGLNSSCSGGDQLSGCQGHAVNPGCFVTHVG